MMRSVRLLLSTSISNAGMGYPDHSDSRIRFLTWGFTPESSHSLRVVGGMPMDLDISRWESSVFSRVSRISFS